MCFKYFHFASGSHSTACLPQVWHNGTEPRYVLYVSVWHPDMWQNAATHTEAIGEALMGRNVAEHKRLCASILDGSFKVPSPLAREPLNSWWGRVHEPTEPKERKGRKGRKGRKRKNMWRDDL